VTDHRPQGGACGRLCHEFTEVSREPVRPTALTARTCNGGDRGGSGSVSFFEDRFADLPAVKADFEFVDVKRLFPEILPSP
jgi:hypothetical protein